MIAASRTVLAIGPGLIERRRERDDAPARAAAVGRLDADGAGQRRRLADRAAGIGRGGGEAEIGGDGRRRAARRAAGHELVGVSLPSLPLRRQGDDDRAEGARLVRRAHGELVVVELAEHDGAGVPQVLRRRSIHTCGLKSSRIFEHAVVRTPLVQNRSLLPSGRPSSGRALPLAMRLSLSASPAPARARASPARRR